MGIILTLSPEILENENFSEKSDFWFYNLLKFIIRISFYWDKDNQLLNDFKSN